MCLCVTDQRWIYHCCSAQCTIDSGASSTATLWWWCLRERAAPTEQLAPVDAARANPMTRESKWLQQVIGLQRASWVHSWYSELYELYACQCSVSVRTPVFFFKEWLSRHYRRLIRVLRYELSNQIQRQRQWKKKTLTMTMKWKDHSENTPKLRLWCYMIAHGVTRSVRWGHRVIWVNSDSIQYCPDKLSVAKPS